MVAASVQIDERSNDPELKQQIVDWWSGDKLSVAQVRTGLRSIGASDKNIKAVKVSDLTPTRFEFAARLARAKGFAGWVLLLDEVELIARFSLLQRARAYAELARWVGVVAGQNIPGITTVAAITDDYATAILTEKNDRRVAPDRLHQKGDAASTKQAGLAKLGINLIDKQAVQLQAPSDDTLAISHEQLRRIYASAYGFVPPGGVPALGTGPLLPMRSHVRRWITNWDLQRLYGAGEHTLIEEEPIQQDYREDPDAMLPAEERAEFAE